MVFKKPKNELAMVPVDFTDAYGTVRVFALVDDLWHFAKSENQTWRYAAWLHGRASRHADYTLASRKKWQAQQVRVIRDVTGISQSRWNLSHLQQFHRQRRFDEQHSFRDKDGNPIVGANHAEHGPHRAGHAGPDLQRDP